MNFWADLSAFRPEITLILGGFFILLFDGWVKQKKTLILLSIIITFSAQLFVFTSETTGIFMQGLLKFSSINHWVRIIVLGSANIVLAMTLNDSKLKNIAEFLAIILWLSAFSIMASTSNHFLPFILGIESVSLLSYFLTGWDKCLRSKEASLKYFLLGGAASAFLIYGISLVYGLSGTLSFEKLMVLFPQISAEPFFLIACLFIFIGLAFKMAAFPLHFWAPDAYEGAPYPAAAFLTIAPKIMGFSLFLRLLEISVVSGIPPSWKLFLVFISILTMLIGSFSALSQSNTKRLLAWSSVTHAGFMLIPLAVFSPQSDSVLVFYWIYYALSNLGAFWCLMLIAQSHNHHESWNYLSGLASRSPFLACVFSIFLLSLLGLPPTAGFMAKFLLLMASLSANQFWLFLTALIATLLGAYYYLKVIRWMYFHPPQLPQQVCMALSSKTKLLLITLSILIFFAGIFPTPVFQKILAI